MAKDTPDPIVQWRELRREAFDEQTLLAHRTGWLLTTQGLFFTAFAVLLTAANFKTFWWVSCLFLPVLGIIVSSMAYYPIRAAADTINYWLNKEKRFVDDNPVLRPLTLADRQPEVHYRSMLWPLSLPGIFVVMWVVLAAITFLQAWSKLIPVPPP